MILCSWTILIVAKSMDELPVILAVGINDRPDCLVQCKQSIIFLFIKCILNNVLFLPVALNTAILETDGQSSPKSEESTSYFWEISNKYYSTKLQFKVCSFADVIISNISSPVEAVIIYFDFVSVRIRISDFVVGPLFIASILFTRIIFIHSGNFLWSVEPIE